ncbi:MAG: bifunctional riboflavin kinase/FAD synthetase [Oscillospiraceae bacterium]|nr:bifunctional riboflavin kinase/FAD synthetase [Oscillospiraceae bacterium]
MEIIHSYEQLNIPKKTAIAVGYFDGMHLGHRELIGKMHEYAEENDMIPMILTFGMSKMRAEGKGKKDLFPREYTMSQAEKMGVDIFADIPFESVVNMTPYSFCKTVLSGKNTLNAGAVFCGEDFRFGKNRAGSIGDLSSFGKVMGFSVVVISDVVYNNDVISTSMIKDALEKGDVEKANHMLGAPYSISGKVIHGNHLAKDMGFPTANILFPEGLLTPQKGVYLTETIIEGEKYRSITNIGTRPTLTEDTVSTAETHVLDYDGDLYGKRITLYFYEFIRPERKFENAEELKKTVIDNITYAKQVSIKTY